ncbi:MAG TPA: UvrD-helicase domain-containing protein, partial [Stellaceae bacterium]|nr:UvrD-helicase domain-containing protein [Stellaceae bacterium]
MTEPLRAQQAAADAAASVWVAASAGTGKTKVLTDRVLALMLLGSEPGRILCLTFTRAAAAEMAIRLNERLSQWT